MHGTQKHSMVYKHFFKGTLCILTCVTCKVVGEVQLHPQHLGWAMRKMLLCMVNKTVFCIVHRR